MSRIEFKIDHKNIRVVSKIIIDHNYPLISPNKAYMLRSHHKVLPIHMMVIDQIEKAGVNPSQTFNFFFEGSQGVKHVKFTKIDYCNYLRTKRMTQLEVGDAQILLDYLKSWQSEDPLFYYAIQIDGIGKVANFF